MLFNKKVINNFTFCSRLNLKITVLFCSVLKKITYALIFFIFTGGRGGRRRERRGEERGKEEGWGKEKESGGRKEEEGGREETSRGKDWRDNGSEENEKEDSRKRRKLNIIENLGIDFLFCWPNHDQKTDDRNTFYLLWPPRSVSTKADQTVNG